MIKPSDLLIAPPLHFFTVCHVSSPNSHFLRRTAAESKTGYSLLIDYVPRLELLSSLEYFDKYFGVRLDLFTSKANFAVFIVALGADLITKYFT